MKWNEILLPGKFQIRLRERDLLYGIWVISMKACALEVADLRE